MNPTISGQSVADRRISGRRIPPGQFHAYLMAIPLVLLSAVGVAMGMRTLRAAIMGDAMTLLERPVSTGLCLTLSAGALLGLAIAVLRMWLRTQEVEKVHGELQRSHDHAMREARRYRRQAEALSLMREIHRAGNIPSSEERLRQVLGALVEAAGVREVTLYSMDVVSGAPRPAALYRSDDGGMLFALLKAGAAGSEGRHWSRGISCRRVSAERRDRNLTIEGDIHRLEERVGHVWLKVCGDGRPALLSQEPADLVESSLRETDIDGDQAGEVFKHHRLLRRLEAKERRLELTMPLNAEHELIGAMRVRLPPVADEEHVGWLESVLVEASGHIGLALKKEQDSIEAITDGLTGLFVKRHFLSELRRLLTERAESGRALCLLMLDIDHFKKVNDTYGHLTGDRVLRGVAQVLTKSLRADDSAFRYGGEEMGVLLPGAPMARAVHAAERIREAVQAAKFVAEDGRPVPVTISIGVTEACPDTRAPEDLIARADQALYASKHNGRNRVTAWSDALAAAKA